MIKKKKVFAMIVNEDLVHTTLPLMCFFGHD